MQAGGHAVEAGGVFAGVGFQRLGKTPGGGIETLPGERKQLIRTRQGAGGGGDAEAAVIHGAARAGLQTRRGIGDIAKQFGEDGYGFFRGGRSG